MQPIFAEDHFLPVFCYIILSTYKIYIYDKCCNNALERNVTWSQYTSKNNIYFRVFTAFNSNRLLKTLIIPLKLNKNLKIY